MSGIKAKKREMLEQARQQAEQLLQQSNATIERTIREIKEAKADKEKTKAARQKVEKMKERVGGLEKKVPKDPKDMKNLKVPKVLRDFSELKKLSKTMTNETEKKSNLSVRSTVRQRTLSFERTLDIRGMRVDEAMEKLIAYMDDALMVGAGEVTILHGTGTGALKQLTRDYLNDLNRFRRKRGQATIDFGDGDPNHGGAGLTLVQLS